MTRPIDADSIPWLVEGVGEIPVITKEEIDQLPTMDIPTAVGESVGAIRCKDCKHDHTCTHMMVRKSSGGGNIYCPVTYCSEGKRKDE